VSARGRWQRFAAIGLAGLIAVQVGTWIAWGSRHFPAVAAIGILRDTGGDFAIDSNSCERVAGRARDICSELAQDTRVQKSTERWSLEFANQSLPGEPSVLRIEEFSSTPLLAHVQFGLRPNGIRLRYVWIIAAWIPLQREFVWIS
jgi:hypothetical protein